MLIIRTEGPDLVQELDVSDDEVICITLSDNECEQYSKEPPNPKKKTPSKAVKQKKQQVKNIQCCNKFFKNLHFEEVPIIQNDQIITKSLDFGVSKTYKKLEFVNKPLLFDGRKETKIPKQLLPNEIQDIQLFVPKIKGVDDKVATNTLFWNHLNEKKLTGLISDKVSLHSLPQTKQRDQYMQQLRELQRSQIENRKIT